MGGNKKNKSKKALFPAESTAFIPVEDDDSLVDDLLAQLDARDSQAQESKPLDHIEPDKGKETEENRQSSRSRFKARETRKAAARVDQQIPDDVEATQRIKKETEDEERTIRELCTSRGLEIFEINPDGHCLYAAVADQLVVLSVSSDATYRSVRQAAADYIASHPDDFLPFLPSTAGKDGMGMDDSGSMNTLEFQKYCANIRDTATWGGEPEILALARAFNVPIHVLQRGVPSVVVHSPHTDAEEVTKNHIVQISYHRRLYGLGEHYNSLRPKNRNGLANSITKVAS